MKYSTRLSDAVHLLLFVHLNPEAGLSSTAIAASICTNPACVRQMMCKLRRAGLLTSTQGRARPALARDIGGITLLDVYRAVEGQKPLLHLDTHTNPECGVGLCIQGALQTYFDRVQARSEEEMGRITLRDIENSCRERLAEGGGGDARP